MSLINIVVFLCTTITGLAMAATLFMRIYYDDARLYFPTTKSMLCMCAIMMAFIIKQGECLSIIKYITFIVPTMMAVMCVINAIKIKNTPFDETETECEEKEV